MTAVPFNLESLAVAWNTFRGALPVRLAAIHPKNGSYPFVVS